MTEKKPAYHCNLNNALRFFKAILAAFSTVGKSVTERGHVVGIVRKNKFRRFKWLLRQRMRSQLSTKLNLETYRDVLKRTAKYDHNVTCFQIFFDRQQDSVNAARSVWEKNTRGVAYIKSRQEVCVSHNCGKDIFGCVSCRSQARRYGEAFRAVPQDRFCSRKLLCPKKLFQTCDENKSFSPKMYFAPQTLKPGYGLTSNYDRCMISASCKC